MEWIGSAISGQAEQYRVLNTIITKELKTDAKAVLSFIPDKISKRKVKNIETDKKTDKKKATITTESGQIDESNESATSNIVTDDIELTEPLEDWARTVYTDKEVAKIEGINKATVTKRRTGKLKSKGSDFWDRWEVSILNTNRWWKKQKGN